MFYARRIILAILPPLMFMACGRGESGSGKEAIDPFRDFDTQLADGAAPLFDQSVPPEQAALLREDLDRIDELPWKDDEAGTLAETLGVEKFDAKHLREWLFARIHVVVGQKFDQYYLGHTPTRYEPSIYSRMDARADSMNHLAAALYSHGKRNRVSVGVHAAGRSIRITSPRAGIVQIGPRLFRSSGDGDSQLWVDSVSRLAILFHEARHSDGNSENVGFPHSTCPEDHVYAGKQACESFANGAYAIERAIIRSIRDGCRDCTHYQERYLDLRLADLQLRHLPGSEGMRADPRPERIP